MATNSTIRLTHARTRTLNRDLVILTELAKELSSEGIACLPQVFATGRIYLQILVDDDDEISGSTITVSISLGADDIWGVLIESEKKSDFILCPEILSPEDFAQLSVFASAGFSEIFAFNHSPELISKLRAMVD